MSSPARASVTLPSGAAHLSS